MNEHKNSWKLPETVLSSMIIRVLKTKLIALEFLTYYFLFINNVTVFILVAYTCVTFRQHTMVTVLFLITKQWAS